MDSDPLSLHLSQPTLFDFSGSSSGSIELFPAVWSAAEGLTSPDVETRRDALERLAKLNAIRLSPLIAYLTATRIVEPDLALRQRIVKLLGDVLAPDELGQPSPAPVIRHLSAYLAQMRRRHLIAVLQTTLSNQGCETAVARLLNACPYAGCQLVDILSDRKISVDIRRQAVIMIGQVGYLDTISSLEREETRLSARLKGQRSMPFAPLSGPDESGLLPAVQNTLDILRSR